MMVARYDLQPGNEVRRQAHRLNTYKPGHVYIERDQIEFML